MGKGAAVGSEATAASSVEDELQESGTNYRNVSVDCGSWVWFSGTLTVKNHYHIYWYMYVSSFYCVQYEKVTSCLLILAMQRDVLCHKRTLRVRVSPTKEQLPKPKHSHQSSCPSPVPQVIPHVNWAGGQTWGKNRALGEGCLCSNYPGWISPARKQGKCTCEGETCQDSWPRGLSCRCHQLLCLAPARSLHWHPPRELLHCRDLTAIVRNRKGRDCFGRLIWCSSLPAYSLEDGMSTDCPHFCFAQVFLLVQWVFSSPSAQAQTVRSQMLEGCCERKLPSSMGTVGEPPASCHAGLPVPAAAQPGVCVLANKVLGDPSGWKALYKCGCQPVKHQEAPLQTLRVCWYSLPRAQMVGGIPAS